MGGRAPLAFRRASGEPLLLLAAFGAILLATTTLVALASYAGSVTEAGVRQAMETAALDLRATTVTTSVRAGDFSQVDRLIRERVAGGYGGVPVRVASSARSDSYAMPGQERAEHPELTRFATYQDLGSHASLLTGRWPSDTTGAATGQGAVEVAVSEAAARLMHVTTGAELTVVGRLDGRPVRARVTGVFRPGGSADDPWADDRLLRAGVEIGDYTTYGPLVVSAGTFLDRFTTGVSATWRTVPQLSGLPLHGLRPLAASVSAIGPVLGRECPACTVSSRLPDMLTQLDQAAMVARSTMLVPVLQLLVLAAYTLTLTARLLADRRRMEVALLRARGGGSVRLAALAGQEALLVALPCAVAAPFLAPPLLHLIGAPARAVRLPPAPGTFAVAAIAALACALLVALPAVGSARRTYVEEQGARGRGTRYGNLQRAGADLGLLIVAVLAIWQLRRYGGPATRTVGGDLGVDPLIVVGPAAALLCGGLLGLRLLPPASRFLERVTARGLRFAPFVGAAQVSRRPTRYGGPALLLTTAVAIAVLSLITAATWRTSQEDQARHLAGADLRVTVPPGDTGREPPPVDGATAATPVNRSTANLDGAEVTLLAADTARLDEIMLLRPDLSDVPLAVLADRLRRTGAEVPVVLTAGLPSPRRLAIGTAVVPVRVVGRVEALPGTSAAAPAVLADLSALRAAGVRQKATEWWLSVAGHDTSAAAAALARDPVVTVTDLGTLTRRLGDDPLADGLRGALTLGFVAALVFAGLGFLISAVASARARATEFALFKALGVTFGQTLGLLMAEQSFVIASSLTGGVLLAIVVAAAVVPAIVLTGQTSAVTPPVLLDIPWPSVAVLVVAVAVPLLAVVAGLGWSLHRRGPGGMLNSGADR